MNVLHSISSSYSSFDIFFVDLILRINWYNLRVALVVLCYGRRFLFQLLKPIKLVENDWQERCN